jgi:alpha-beta hydrolase superfamily lysophospholipase
MKKIFLIFFVFVCLLDVKGETITIKAIDGVEVTMDLHIAHPDSTPFIILFHQAGWSRGEYQEIAPQLNQLGFNCAAVDLRSGKGVNDVPNLTTKSARKLMKETKYINSIPDMEAALAHVKTYFAKGKVIIWGSSYSSALVLKMAGDRAEEIDGVLAFSPGEYFKSMGKPGDFIRTSAALVKCPSFITSARGEQSSWWKIHEAIPTTTKAFYLPVTSGNHGSRALWVKFSDHKGYWTAVNDFLSQYL